MAYTHALSTNQFGCAAFIVDASAANGTHTTISLALAQAVSGQTIFIKPGTYTENLTLVAGVNLTAFGSDSSSNNTGNVKITGKATFTTAGSITIFGIELQTNSDFFLAVTGSAASIVNLNNCYLNCVNNTGISYTSSSGSSAINVNYCSGDLGTTGIGFHSSSGANSINYKFCNFTNSGASTTNTTNSAGTANYYYSYFSSPIGCTSGGNINVFHSNINCFSLNHTAISIAGTASSISEYSIADAGGTQAAVTVGSGATLQAVICNFTTTASPAVSGAGTINYTGIQPGLNRTINPIGVTSQTGGSWIGIQNGTAPAGGYIGESISSSVADGSVSFTNNTAKNVTSITLTPGCWSISANASCSTNSTATQKIICITTTSATNNADYGNTASLFTGTLSGTYHSLCVPNVIVNLSAATTVYYLVGFILFSAGSGTMGGRITATRIG